MERGQLSQIVEARLKLARRDQCLLPRAGDGPEGNLGRSGSVGALQTPAIGDDEVYDRRRNFDILRTRGSCGDGF